MTLTETPAAGAIASIIKATQRLNPCMELDVDILAVTRAAVNSTAADWNAGTPTNVTVDPSTGAVRLSLVAAATLFSQTNAAFVVHPFRDGTDGVEEFALDFFLDPSIAQGVHIELDSLDVVLGKVGGSGVTIFDKSGIFRVQVAYYDENWRLVPMGDPMDIAAPLISLGGGVYKIDFTALQRRFIFAPGAQNTNTGAGFDGTTIRTLNVDTKGVSHIPNVARGLSISIQPMGKNFQGAFIGLVANATAAQFDTTAFWRRSNTTQRNCGPYNPTNQPYSGTDVEHNPDNYLITGAVPGYGAKAVTNGSWGIARRIINAQRAQRATTWEQPYHVLRVKAYSSSGSIVSVLDMGAVPTHDVEIRLDDWQQKGTSITYTLQGSNISGAGAWTSIGTVVDGQILTSANYYRWYQLTATFTPGPSGATKYASPALQAWSMVERTKLSTYRYLKDIDSTAVADPVTAQSSIGELTLPVLNVGRQDFRDLASQLGSNFAPAYLEAHVYARNTRSGTRLFLNAYRLENRDPKFGVEEMTFVSGMDRLTIKVPAAVETFRYPTGSGTAPATTVTNPSGTTYRIAPGGTPFTAGALNGMRMHGVTGQCAGLDYPIQPGNTTAYFEIVTGGTQVPPASGDTFEIHSDQTTRSAAPYVGQDFAAVYADLLAVQAAVPARYRGALPATTGRTTSYALPAEGVKALDVLQHVALHCGGFPAWIKGRISYVDFYGRKDSVFTWGDRQIVSLETPVGADRRMPSVRVQYGYQADTKKFTNQATYEDFDTLVGWGRSNLFDIFEIPDDVCRWNDQAEARHMAGKFQDAWKSGVRLWKVKTVLNYPWLEQGDAGTILTDQYTDRRLAFSADGVTDVGVPIAGRTAALAVIVGKNLWGNEFIVAVRGLDAITASAVATSGSVAVPTIGTQAPKPTITPLNTEVDDTVWNLRFDAVAGSGGGGANFAYDIRSKKSFGSEASLGSGGAPLLPRDLGIVRDPRSDQAITFIVTDILTGLSSRATYTVPSQRDEIDNTGRPKRAKPFDDGNWAPKASDSGGSVIHQTVTEFTGRRLTEVQRGSIGPVFSEIFENIDTELWSVSDSGQGGTISVALSSNSTKGTKVLVANNYKNLLYRGRIPIDPNKYYRFRIRLARTVDTGTGNLIYAGFIGELYDASGANVNSGARYVLVAGENLAVATGFVERTCWMKGCTLAYASTSDGLERVDPGFPSAFNEGTVNIRPYLLLNYLTADGQVMVDYFDICEYDEDGMLRLFSTIEGGGTVLTQTTSARNGAAARNLASGRQSHTTGVHGSTITFPSNYQNPPQLHIWGGVSYEPASVWASTPGGVPGSSAPANTRQIDDISAVVTSSTAVLRALIKQSGASTARSDNYASGAITSIGGDKEVTTANAPAANDTYSSDYTYSFTLQGTNGVFASQTGVVALDYWNGSSWIEVNTATYSGGDDAFPFVLSGSDVLAATVTGLTGSSKFRIRVKSHTKVGGLTPLTRSVDPGTCDYTTATGEQYASRTPVAGITLMTEIIGAS